LNSIEPQISSTAARQQTLVPDLPRTITALRPRWLNRVHYTCTGFLRISLKLGIFIDAYRNLAACTNEPPN
ncbi:MAG: hypothetical protein WD005_02820, partial [Haliea sp.]